MGVSLDSILAERSPYSMAMIVASFVSSSSVAIERDVAALGSVSSCPRALTLDAPACPAPERCFHLTFIALATAHVDVHALRAGLRAAPAAHTRAHASHVHVHAHVRAHEHAHGHVHAHTHEHVTYTCTCTCTYRILLVLVQGARAYMARVRVGRVCLRAQGIYAGLVVGQAAISGRQRGEGGGGGVRRTQ